MPDVPGEPEVPPVSLNVASTCADATSREQGEFGTMQSPRDFLEPLSNTLTEHLQLSNLRARRQGTNVGAVTASAMYSQRRVHGPKVCVCKVACLVSPVSSLQRAATVMCSFSFRGQEMRVRTVVCLSRFQSSANRHATSKQRAFVRGRAWLISATWLCRLDRPWATSATCSLLAGVIFRTALLKFSFLAAAASLSAPIEVRPPLVAFTTLPLSASSALRAPIGAPTPLD